MKKRISAIALFLVLFASGTILGQTADCRKKCQDRKTQCLNQCMVMAADNTGCAERCETESARCLGACKEVKADTAEGVDDDDAEYEDTEDDDGDDDFDKEDDLDNDEDFKDMEDDI
ncbi:MAG: hypothetical protein KA369_06950 [Spirochaetes bacterium]|nr:hypothetical protein [Spirochaetota bacterium]